MSRKSVKKSAWSTLKQRLSGKNKAVSQILGDVKKVNPEQWKNRSQVERLTKKYIGKLGLSVPEQRIKKFVDAYMNTTKNGESLDDVIKKYGKNVDTNAAKELKKYIPKM